MSCFITGDTEQNNKLGETQSGSGNASSPKWIIVGTTIGLVLLFVIVVVVVSLWRYRNKRQESVLFCVIVLGLP